ncbi:hypothetical protein ACFRC1_29435 [Streptomyces sp. NPDC056626]|uniref:hypothetical protein n=1 Tax=Streptomyces sp. NPDC056626 TaxID=3345880 RepID=UPI003674DA28
MPRRRPGEVRTALCQRHRTHAATTVIDGLSRRALGEIDRLERTRAYLGPGEVAAAVRLWKEYVRTPERLLWQDHERGNSDWDCCGGDPWEARALLGTVTHALSARSARELRAVVARSDGVWGSAVG